MRVRLLVILNVMLFLAVLGLGLGYVAALPGGTPLLDEAQAQPLHGARPGASLRVAVVNLTHVFDTSDDIEKLQELIKLIDDLARLQAVTAQDAARELSRDLDAIDDDSTQEFRELLGDMINLDARAAVAEEMGDYRKRRAFARYARQIFEKLLWIVKLQARGTYDLVFKAYEPSPEEMDLLEQAAVLNLDKLLQFHQARSLLYRTDDGDRVADITDRVLEAMGRQDVVVNEVNVSQDLQDEIAKMRALLEEYDDEDD